MESLHKKHIVYKKHCNIEVVRSASHNFKFFSHAQGRTYKIGVCSRITSCKLLHTLFVSALILGSLKLCLAKHYFMFYFIPQISIITMLLLTMN